MTGLEAGFLCETCFCAYGLSADLMRPSHTVGFPGGSEGKESACSAGDPGLIPGLGRSPGEGNGYPLQCSCLENSMYTGAWWGTVHGVAKRHRHDGVTNTFALPHCGMKSPILKISRYRC